MGVADRQTYKNQYHFTDDSKDTSKEHPSIEQEPKINATIKKNPYRSNVEIEGDEIVLQPDLSALFKAVGKRHSKGGMDVLLKPESFIFSDYDGLKITPREHELFELKEGGTPAQTLKKNINPKHYNTMVNILDNPFRDDLSKKSASKMLEKYISTLGNIAFIQEQKKGFPTGIPEFAMGTAPVYNTDTKDTIDAGKQYMKAGGSVNNPSMQTAGEFKKINNQDGSYTIFRPNGDYEVFFPNGRIKYYDSKTKTFEMGTANEFSTMKDVKDIKKDKNGITIITYTSGKTTYVYPNNRFMTINSEGKRAMGTVEDGYLSRTDSDETTYSKYQEQGWYDDNGFLKNKQQSNNVSPSQTPRIPTQTSIPTTNLPDVPTDIDPRIKDEYVAYLADVKKGLTKSENIGKFQKKFHEIYPDEARDIISKMPVTKHGRLKGLTNTDIDSNLDNFDGPRTKQYMAIVKSKKNIPEDKDTKVITTPNVEPKKSADPLKTKIEVEDIKGSPAGSKSADWKFTPEQKLSQLWQWGQYANVKKYMPYRSRYTATYVDPALVNPEQAVGDAKGMSNQQLSSLNTLNPILRNAQASSVYGQLLNQIPAIRTQYDNQNAQITNQARMYNNQVKNNESMVNMANDQQYYQQDTTANVNYDNMKNFLGNQAMDTRTRQVETNQKLAYNLLTQNNPAWAMDWNTGKLNRTNKSIMDAQGSAGTDMFTTLLEDLRKMPKTDQNYQNMIQLLKIKEVSPYLKDLSNPFNTSQKKGGKVKKKNPYRY